MRFTLLLLLFANLQADEVVANPTISMPIGSKSVQIHVTNWTDATSGKRFLIFYQGIDHFQVIEAPPKPIKPKPPIETKDLPVESNVPIPEMSRTYGTVPDGWIVLRTEREGNYTVKIIQRVGK